MGNQSNSLIFVQWLIKIKLVHTKSKIQTKCILSSWHFQNLIFSRWLSRWAIFSSDVNVSKFYGTWYIKGKNIKPKKKKLIKKKKIFKKLKCYI